MSNGAVRRLRPLGRKPSDMHNLTRCSTKSNHSPHLFTLELCLLVLCLLVLS